MSRFLFAWELGAALGHVGRIEPLAEALAGRGHRIALALRELPRAGRLGRRVEAALYQAPFAPRHPEHRVPPPNYGGMLLRCGYEDPAGLETLVEAWRNLIRAEAPDLVVADHSPTALLAARCAGVPACAIGAGYSIPPEGPITPTVQPWHPAEPVAMASADALALEAINHCLRAAGLAELDRVAALFDPARDLLQSFPELDHYPARERARYVGPPPPAAEGRDPDWAGSPGPRVFAYLDGRMQETPPLLERLAAAPCSVLVLVRDAVRAALPQGPRLRYAERPLDPAWVARHADLAITHGGSLTGQLLLRGLRVLVQPTQGEQSILAYRLLERGLIGMFERGLSVEAGGQAIYNAAVDEGLHEAAQGLARKYAGHDGATATAEAAGFLEALAGA